VFQNRVLKGIVGSKGAEMAEDWRRLQNEELHIFEASPNIWVIKPRRIRWVSHIACMEYEKFYTNFWSENLKGRSLGRSRCRWEDNIRTDLREIGWKDVERIHLVQDRDQ
jgi:hypothetical protein